ncbi:MAG: VCBS repeat-containing protein [Cellulophaga sp.]
MKNFIFYFGIAILLFSCSTKNKEERFTYVTTSDSKLDFNNTIIGNDSLNIVTFQYIYNGGGVGIGDFNNDGLHDVVFTGNQVSSKIYLNKGKLTFLDISNKAGFTTNSWVTGVAIVDINSDGWDDIYLSVGGPNCNNDCENLLFINQGLNKNGTPTFTEEAKAYQLNDPKYSQQAVFLDYDLDGDLDVFIAHNGKVRFSQNSPVPKHYMPKELTDYLLRNDSKPGVDHPVFTNVSDSLGIKYQGFSLGVCVQDINNDNLPDIYVTNDFLTEDLLYLNNGLDSLTNKHKGFSEINKEFLSQQTYNAMGVDIADVNNNGYPDVLVLDMFPENYNRQKSMLGTMNYDKFLTSKRNNYTPQFMHNSLQINNGLLNNTILKASETANFSGIAATDWSWSPMMVDFDNDGDKDIYITNGYVKDITDLDFINYSKQSTIFGSEDSKNKKLSQLIAKAPGVFIPNYFYENNNTLKFKNVSNQWSSAKNSFSNGAAFADLDNDGDLDIVVNNINQNAFILQNNTTTLEPQSNFLRLKLKGTSKNIKAIGTKINMWTNGTMQTQYQSLTRGYLSSVEPIIHFGVKANKVDSLKVTWPNNLVATLYNPKLNSLVEIDISSAKENNTKAATTATILKANTSILSFTHKENSGHDFVSQHLLMRQYSKFGPCIAAANINLEAGDELFIGGSKGEPSSIWTQNKDGVYQITQKLDSIYEDTAATFLDIDNDNDLDLYVASGGSEFDVGSNLLQDRIYVNNGKGKYTLTNNNLPKQQNIGSCIAAYDYDKDGDKDIFVGSRLVKGRYPTAPSSTLLQNNAGVLSPVKNDTLTSIGMVTDATWQDVNNDGWQDLVVVGEWMPITVFINNNGTLEKSTTNWVDSNDKQTEVSGWWNTIKAGDFDNDGDIDFIVGNQGENSFVCPKVNKPVYVYNQDFDNNGSIDPIVAQYFNDPTKNNVLLPVQTRDDVMKQLVVLKQKYNSYKDFSEPNFETLLDIKDLDKETLKATTFASSYIENLGNNTFKIKKLPESCQLAPINDILIKDIDNDGYLDALLVGNDATSETIYGTTLAIKGVYLKGSKDGFKVVENSDSGFYVPHQSNHIIEVHTADKKSLIIATQNNRNTLNFTINKNIK